MRGDQGYAADVERRVEPQAVEEYYLTLFEEFPALIWRANTNAECDWFNKTWLEFTGRTMEQEHGAGWTEGVHPDDLDRCVDIWLSNFKTQTAFVMDYRLMRHDGEYRWIRDFGRPFNDPRGAFAGYIGACYDVTDMRTYGEQMEYLATHDVLTSLPNRRAFDAEVVKALEFANRGRPGYILFCDIDRFKRVNDQHGHAFGDLILTEVGNALTATVRSIDFVARIGGDEFGIVLRDDAIDELPAIVGRLHDAVVEVGRRHSVDIGLSVGSAKVAEGGSYDDVLTEADRNMYANKMH